MLTFGASPFHSPRLNARTTVASPPASTDVPSLNRHVRVTDTALSTLEEVRTEKPEEHAAFTKGLNHLISGGDRFLLSQHGDNSPQVRSITTQEALRNLADIKYDARHTPQGRMRASFLERSANHINQMHKNVDDVATELREKGIDPEALKVALTTNSNKLRRLTTIKSNQTLLKNYTLHKYNLEAAINALELQYLYEPVMSAFGSPPPPPGADLESLPSHLHTQVLLQAKPLFSLLQEGGQKDVKALTTSDALPEDLDVLSPEHLGSSIQASSGDSVRETEAPAKKEKTDAQKAAAKRKRDNYKAKQKAKKADQTGEF